MHMYAKLKPNNLKESLTSLKDRLALVKGGGTTWKLLAHFQSPA
jgi:hypothetical protein